MRADLLHLMRRGELQTGFPELNDMLANLHSALPFAS